MSEFKKDSNLARNKALQSDGLDVEFSIEEADQDDLEALARSKAADERAHNRSKK